MPKYKVTLTEMIRYEVTVEADNRSEAAMIACATYDDDNSPVVDNDVFVDEIEEVK